MSESHDGRTNLPATVEFLVDSSHLKIRVHISGGHYFDVPAASLPPALRNPGCKITIDFDNDWSIIAARPRQD